MNYEHPIIHLYENILCHRIHGFSPYFFAGDEGKHNARIITRYVLQEKEHWNHEDICCGICRELLAEYRLAGMLKTYFQNSIFKVVENAYPGEFQPWELIKARKHVFVGETGRDMARKAVRWMVVDKLNYTLKDLHKITIKTFIEYKLGRVVNKIYHAPPGRRFKMRDSVHSTHGKFIRFPTDIGRARMGEYMPLQQPNG